MLINETRLLKVATKLKHVNITKMLTKLKLRLIISY